MIAQRSGQRTNREYGEFLASHRCVSIWSSRLEWLGDVCQLTKRCTLDGMPYIELTNLTLSAEDWEWTKIASIRNC